MPSRRHSKRNPASAKGEWQVVDASLQKDRPLLDVATAATTSNNSEKKPKRQTNTQLHYSRAQSWLREEDSRKRLRKEYLALEQPGEINVGNEEPALSQKEIWKDSALINRAKFLDLRLPEFGPYMVDYTANGRFSLLGGKLGHIACFDAQVNKLACEFNVNETVRNVSWLHNETMFAVAQKEYGYIYDRNGVELHCLRRHVRPLFLEFLNYHLLLVSGTESGDVVYQDISTGEVAATLHTKKGRPSCMRQNPTNAVIHVGHSYGMVTFWTPSQSDAVVSLRAHCGPVLDLAFNPTGDRMLTTGADGWVKLWDLRMFKPLYEVRTGGQVQTVDSSQRGLLALATGCRVNVYDDAFDGESLGKPFLTHGLDLNHSIQNLRFRPFEDVLALGHAKGVMALLVPGAGAAEIDTLAANPYETRKQRQEGEVKRLLEKVQPYMITLDPEFYIGKYDPQAAVNKADADVVPSWLQNLSQYRVSKKRKGQNKGYEREVALKGALRQAMAREKRRDVADERLGEAKDREEKEIARMIANEEKDGVAALSRFYRKKVDTR